LPVVSGTRTVVDLVPKDQEPKLALVRDAADLLGPTLAPPVVEPEPGDAEIGRALAAASAALIRAAATGPGETAGPASRLGVALRAVADGPETVRGLLHAALVPGLAGTLDSLRLALDARAVSLAEVPDTVRRDWIAPDGRARVEVRPRDLSDRSEAMTEFARAVRSVAPGASGPAVLVQAGSATICDAFLRAGAIATALIVLLLLLALRSGRLALLALAPLALAGLLTLATCALIGLPLNLANVIALPLLFAQGVAFDIYYVAAWARGERSLLPSSLTRAVLYSALTNGTAFGTLATSGHPGTAGMGVLLSMSLLYALAAVMLTLPSLLTLFSGRIGR
jgi:hypothetical protein